MRLRPTVLRTRPEPTTPGSTLASHGPGRTSDGYVCNLVPSADTRTDWTLEDLMEAGLLRAEEIPEEVDLREPWWQISDQGRTGSCVGWATADGVGRYVMVKAGRITTEQRLSARFVWMASKEIDEFTDRPTSFVEEAGTTLKAAIGVAERFGFALETELPFDINDVMFTGGENAFYASCAQRRISYINLTADFGAWRTWLATKGPIQAGLAVDNAFASHRSDKPLDAFSAASAAGGHAVAIVGYRADGSFIVRNSWGTDWGDDGFAYVTPEYVEQAFFPESYGILAA